VQEFAQGPKKASRASQPNAVHVFIGPKGTPLDVNNLRKRIRYPTLDQCGLRRRTMYQTRHAFASLMPPTADEKKRATVSRNPLIVMIAGPGFEPGTFGL